MQTPISNTGFGGLGNTAVPFHIHNGIDAPTIAFPNLNNRTRYIIYRILAPATSNAPATKVGGNLVIPFSGNFTTSVAAFVDTAGTSGTETVDIQLNGTSIFNGTLITIASGATDSTIYTAPLTINSFQARNILTFNIGAVQSSAALGLTVEMKVTETSQ